MISIGIADILSALPLGTIDVFPPAVDGAKAHAEVRERQADGSAAHYPRSGMTAR
jgi:hypothetical protein